MGSKKGKKKKDADKKKNKSKESEVALKKKKKKKNAKTEKPKKKKKKVTTQPVEKLKKKKKKKKIATEKPKKTSAPKRKRINKEYRTTMVAISDIKIAKGFNPRTGSSRKEIDALIKSMKGNGLIHPITLWEKTDAKGKKKLYMVSGQRRLNAAKTIGWAEISATIRDDIASEADALILAIAENAEDSRTALSPIEEAEAYQRLIEDGWKQANIARKIGCSATKVKDALKLLKAPKKAQTLLRNSSISADTVRAIDKIDDTGARNHVLDNLSKGTVASDVTRWKNEHLLEKGRKQRKSGKKVSEKEMRKTRAELSRAVMTRPKKDIESTLIRIVERYRSKKSKKTEKERLSWIIMTLLYVLQLVPDINKAVLESHDFEMAIKGYYDKLDLAAEKHKKAAEIDEEFDSDDDDFDFDDEEDIMVDND